MKKSMTYDEYLSQLPKERQDRIKKLADVLQKEYELRRIREEIGMTQSQLASLMGVSQPSIANLEKKGADIKLSTLHRYFDALGIEGTIQIKLPSGELRHIAI
ncbi:MAG: helix-turn-helix domain-containing protein [Burkholderiaceae bacterium]|jgi:DNA-binding XRE family transcriptional regulator|nr:helix-turn-helix domain-containing protein [Burkholderiaceae bacterium]MBR2960276.1 helix-turn-helix domain-containing protein [Burkholderiaceae bacterium]